MSYAVTTENLTKRYGDRIVVDDLSLRIPEGCVYGFLINSSSERIKSKASGRSKKFLQRASYIAVFILVLTLVATSYTHADSITQVSLSGVSTSNSTQ